MILVKNMFFAYEKEKPVICDFSYHFRKGKTYVITGDNGCGKTTLLKLLLGLIKPDSGEIIQEQNSSVGYLPDYNGLYEHLSVIDNIRFRLGINNKSLDEVKDLYEEWMGKYKIKKYEKSLVKNLSLGTKKKVGLMCALMIKPEILFMDEPTGGLDSAAKKELISIIHEKQKDVTIIVVTHDMDFVDSLNCVKIEM